MSMEIMSMEKWSDKKLAQQISKHLDELSAMRNEQNRRKRLRASRRGDHVRPVKLEYGFGQEPAKHCTE